MNKNLNQTEATVPDTDPEPASETDPRKPRSGHYITSRIERIDPADKDADKHKE